MLWARPIRIRPTSFRYIFCAQFTTISSWKKQQPMPMDNFEEEICKDVPNLVSSFVDSFVDFSVSGGLFLPPVSPDHGSQNAPSLHDHQPEPSSSQLHTWLPSPDRLIAVGDLHGDLSKSKEALRLAGLIDGSERWIGGSATVVQIGDVLDRGGDELKILYFLEKLKREAAKDGGMVITMNGNHEIMNVEGDFRYVTKEGLEEFRAWGDWFSIGNKMKALCVGLEMLKDPFEGIPMAFRGVKEEFHPGFRARIAALHPNGPISGRFLSHNTTVLVIGESVFVHGGLLPGHVSYGLERINEEVRDWIKGLSGKFAPDYCRRSNAVVWLRKFSDELAKNCDCSLLQHVLDTIPGAKRMIMGHTIQMAGINGVCNNQAIRIDVGMSKGCADGFPEVLEFIGNSPPRILTSNPYLKQSMNSLKVDSKDGLGLLLHEHGHKQVEVKA